MGRPTKPLISRSATLKAALQIIDQEGLEELSIRRLGRELNVQGISLYHHFKNKDDILAGVCEIALSGVRTPNASHTDWHEWLLHNAIAYRRALQEHPNLISVLMRRHPMRIGLKEHDATAALLAVQGVPVEAIMPLVEVLEELALGSASYQSAVDNDKHTEVWKESYPHLFHLSRKTSISKDRIFELVARASIDTIIKEIGGLASEAQSTSPNASKPKAPIRARAGRVSAAK